MAFSIFTILYNNCLSLLQDIFMTPKENPNPIAVTAISPFLQLLAVTTLLSVSMIYLF